MHRRVLSGAFVRADMDGALAVTRLAQGLRSAAHKCFPACGKMLWPIAHVGRQLWGPGTGGAGTRTQAWDLPVSIVLSERSVGAYVYISVLFLIFFFFWPSGKGVFNSASLERI